MSMTNRDMVGNGEPRNGNDTSRQVPREDQDVRGEDREEEKPPVVVNVARGFTHTHQDGTTEYFRPGAYELPHELANHWYVQAHCEDQPPPRRTRAGTPRHEEQRAIAGYQDTLDTQAEEAEIAAAAAEIRERRRRERSRRPGERARLDEGARREAMAAASDDREGPRTGASRSEPRRDA